MIAIEQAVVRGARWRWAWLVALLAAAAFYPPLVWNSGAVAYDAAHVHIYRALVFSGATAEGVIFPRWAQFFHNGLGSPVFTFYAPLPYYALDLLARLGLAQPLGWRVLVAGGLLAACTGCYLLVHEITHEKWPAVLAAVAYLYAPYVLRNSLERGSTEAFCVFLYPWVLWALVWLSARPSRIRFLVATLLWAAAIATHVLGPLMLVPLALAAAAVLAWRRHTAAPLLALLAGALLTAFVWLPMLAERSYVHADLGFRESYVQPWANPLPLDRLLAAPALYDTQRENNDTGDRIGLLQTALLLAALPAAVYAWRRGRRQLAVWLGAAAVVGLGLLWSFTASADGVWRLFAPVLKYLQFRSRLMGIEALAAAVAAGLLLALLPRRRQPLPALVLAGLLILVALPALYINLRHQYAPIGASVSWGDVRAAEFKLEDSALTAFGETVPVWRDVTLDRNLQAALGPDFDPARAPLADASPGQRVTSAQVASERWDLNITADRAGPVTLHLLYYPRWQASIDGHPVAIRPQPGAGYAQLDLPAGEHHVTLRYATSPAEATGLALAALGILGLGIVMLWPRSWAVLGTQATTEPRSVPIVPNREPVRRRPAPALWLLLAITGLLAFKFLYVDGSTTWLRCVSTADSVCGAQHTTNLAFPGGLRLRGYTVDTPQVRPGGEIRLALYWQVDQAMTEGRYNFLNVRNAELGRPANPATNDDTWISVQHEGPGGFFNTAYLPGRIYRDEYRVKVPANMPPGKYALETGWLDVATGDAVPPEPGVIISPLARSERGILLPDVEVR